MIMKSYDTKRIITLVLSKVSKEVGNEKWSCERNEKKG